MEKIFTNLDSEIIDKCYKIGVRTGSSVYYKELPHDDIDIVITEAEAKHIGIVDDSDDTHYTELLTNGVQRTRNTKDNNEIVNIIIVDTVARKDVWKRTTEKMQVLCMFDKKFRRSIEEKHIRIQMFRKIFDNDHIYKILTEKGGTHELHCNYKGASVGYC